MECNVIVCLHLNVDGDSIESAIFLLSQIFLTKIGKEDLEISGFNRSGSTRSSLSLPSAEEKLEEKCEEEKYVNGSVSGEVSVNGSVSGEFPGNESSPVIKNCATSDSLQEMERIFTEKEENYKEQISVLEQQVQKLEHREEQLEYVTSHSKAYSEPCQTSKRESFCENS